MIRSMAKATLVLSLVAAGIGPVASQDAAPPAQSSGACGGLVCDLGLFGTRAPAAAAAPADPSCGFFCRTFGIGAPAPAPQVAQAAAPEPVAPVDAPKKKHKKKHRTPAPDAEAK